MMGLYETLRKCQAKTRYYDSEEWAYYAANSPVLSSLPGFEFLLKPEDTFDVVRANVVIRGYFAKRKLESAYKTALSAKKKDPSFDVKAALDKVRSGLPYFERGSEVIYIPFFAGSVNRLYGGDMSLLEKAPYDSLLRKFEGLLIDPFESYGPRLYASLFTRLTPVYEDARSGGMAFYDFDAERLYFVNSQGRLDAMLCYFDKYMRSVSKTGVLVRSLPVAEGYYAGDKRALLRALSGGKLVSAYLLSRLEKEGRR